LAVPPRVDEATIAALAIQTDTDRSIVKCLYAEELAILESQARVKNFIGIIAARRVRRRLDAQHEDSQLPQAA
jgi:Protein of unknown function (DUF3562)